MTAMQNLNNFKIELQKICSEFKEEISSLRVGRANPDLVAKILIDCYNSKMFLDQLASISADDARTLRVQPWDKSLILSIERGIRNSNTGFQPVVDKETIRITIPELTEERRKSLIKVLKEKFEHSRVNMKLKRDDVWRDVQNQEQEGKISEDEKFRLKDELQKIIDEEHEELEKIYSKKEKEIMS